MSSAVREARKGRGWSQQQLADAAGVSRQLVGAVEAGRHLPAVDAALRLAAALGATVEELFGAPGAGARPVAVLDGPPAPGGPVPVSVGRVGDRLVHAPAPAGEGVEAWGVPDGILGEAGLELLPQARPADVVAVGCDPALGLLAALFDRRGPHRALVVNGSSAAAVAALCAGRAHIAVVHGPAGGLPPAPRGAVRVPVARWTVGIASAEAAAPRTVEELLDRRLLVVQREDGAGSQAALERALARVGAEAVPGPRAGGHLQVARRVAAGVTTGEAAGVTMEPAARRFGLGFLGLEEHAVELWVAEGHATGPVAAFAELVADPSFRSRLAAVGGYRLPPGTRSSAAPEGP
jgi:DNA-binding XRE family transcriptional regulator/molybdate-binding protein